MTKKEILQRLLEDKHITFEEMWLLMEEEIVYIPQFTPLKISYPVPYPVYPLRYTVTCQAVAYAISGNT